MLNHIELAKECERLRAENEALRAAFHRNMVILHPNKSHDEIAEAIDRAMKG